MSNSSHLLLSETSHIERHGWVVASTPLSQSLSDRGDEPFLVIAVSGKADYLVTGNAAHFPAGLCQGMDVVSPGDFRIISVDLIVILIRTESMEMVLHCTDK